MSKTIFEKSQEGQHAFSLPKDSSAFQSYQVPPHLQRKAPISLPEISEIDLTRHFSQLAHRNMSIDTHFYPLGSCTMKLNPRINEWCANLPGFIKTHPLAPEETVQGNLHVIHQLIQMLCRICGMTSGSLLPNAGAQGEFTGIQMIAAYHRSRNEYERLEILIPEDAHGTNPATAAMSGLKAVAIPIDNAGEIDLNELKKIVSDKTAGLMLTNPNTLGLFNPKILEIAKIIHSNGGLLYYDGANLNSILNIIRPGEMGFDVMHINLHKTFSTPHGGGGPGSGPVLCNDRLKPFLPVPYVEMPKDEKHSYKLVYDSPQSIGKIASFHGNFGIYLRAYVYAMLHGHYGLRRIAEHAVLNANYLKVRLKHLLTIPFERHCMHEFVAQANKFSDKDIRALDIAKRLLDYGVHAPTVYFPLIIKECLLIEPTESESLETLDHFVSILEKIIQEIQTNPEIVKNAPHLMPVSRLDEKQAVKSPILKHQA